jgi:hypothetical protein
MKTHLKNKNGSLTRYALDCGCVERHGDLDLSRQGIYYRVAGWMEDKHVWEFFTRLGDARKFIRLNSRPIS